MAEDLGDKTEEPTTKRLAEARRDGNVARSTDLASAGLLSAAAIAIVILGPAVAEAVGGGVRYALDPAGIAEAARTEGVRSLVATLFTRMGIAVAPLFAVMAVVAAAVHVGQFGFLITGKPLEPKLSKISPLKGIKRVFSVKSLVKGGAGIAKVTAVVLVVAVVVAMRMGEIVALPGIGAAQGVAVAGRIAVEVVAAALAVILLLGAADFWFQKAQRIKELRMTKQQVKDERKNAEGDPEMKGRRMRAAREIAMQRVNAAVPDADVVVTNPTHFAVALWYDQEDMNAPRVVAKGADYLAARIRLIAAEHGVPIVERPPLARALYAAVEVGQEVPAEQYQAVAEILAYVYRIGAGAEAFENVAQEQPTEQRVGA